VFQWKVAHVTEWLLKVELRELVETFKDNSVDGELLLSLSEKDLFEGFKINKYGHRKKIMDFIKKYSLSQGESVIA